MSVESSTYRKEPSENPDPGRTCSLSPLGPRVVGCPLVALRLANGYLPRGVVVAQRAPPPIANHDVSPSQVVEVKVDRQRDRGEAREAGR